MREIYTERVTFTMMHVFYFADTETTQGTGYGVTTPVVSVVR